jgi:hypothetical protein
MGGRSSSAAVVACGFLQGAMAFTGNHAAALGRGLSLARPGAAAAAQRGYPRRRPALDLYMQNAPGKPPAPRAETGVLDLFVKSQPSSREGIDLFVGEDAAVFDWADEKMGALGERGWLTFFAAVGAILSALAVLVHTHKHIQFFYIHVYNIYIYVYAYIHTYIHTYATYVHTVDLPRDGLQRRLCGVP